MLGVADAALLIGDPALRIDPAAYGVEKIDLGEAWRTLTGLPFVYAAWTGRPGVLGPTSPRGAGSGARRRTGGAGGDCRRGGRRRPGAGRGLRRIPA